LKNLDQLKSIIYSSKGVFYILFIVIVLMAQLRQQKNNNFDCEICSDKAGYYMYLPAIFHYGFQASKYPKNFDHEHGDGFYFDGDKDRVITKFTCGIALLQIPFYGIGYCIDQLFGINANPYSNYYLFFINIGLAFYLVMGLYYLRKWYTLFVGEKNSLLAIIIIFFGTNLFYYTIDESLMSHAYSFSLFSIMLYLSHTLINHQKTSYLILYCLIASSAILIRPTSVLFIPISIFVQLNGLQNVKKKLAILFKPINLIIALIVLSLVMAPQILYWKYAYEQYFIWSYKGEGFTNWNQPKWLIVWFSPQSGVFTYTPLMLFSLIATFLIKKLKYRWWVILVFLMVSYVTASWHNPWFGVCNFGKRPFIEFYPILMLPIAYIFKEYKSLQKLSKVLVITLLVVLLYYNIVFTLGFNTCFFGDTWSWNAFGLLLKKIFLFK